MSYEAAVLVSILRSVLAGWICVWLGRGLVRWREDWSDLPSAVGVQGRLIAGGKTAFPDSPSVLPPIQAPTVSLLDRLGNAKQFATAVLLLPFFMPGLVVGYAYRNASLSLVQSPLMNELLYFSIVVSQLVPVAVLILEWLPSAAMGPSGMYCLRLAVHTHRRPSIGTRFRALMVGELPRSLTTGAIVALLCFQEVEVATLMQACGWAEWIFTKQAGGVELVDVWGSLVLPVVYGLGLVVPVLSYWIFQSSSQFRRVTPRTQTARSIVERTSCRRLAMLSLAVAWLLTVIWPTTSLIMGAWRGAGVLQLRSAIWQEIGDALILAVTVTCLLAVILWSMGTCQTFVARGQTSTRRNRTVLVAVVIVLLPGLLGALALGLILFEFCQQIGWQPSYTPVPLVLGMVLFLLPRAIAMQAMLRWGEIRSDVFLAEALTPLGDRRADWGGAILWRLRGAGRFWTLALLFWWSYLELTLPSLLRPAGMAPAPMRLYNFLHYGHIPGLAAMLVLVLGVPLALVIIGHRSLSRRFRTSLR